MAKIFCVHQRNIAKEKAHRSAPQSAVNQWILIILRMAGRRGRLRPC